MYHRGLSVIIVYFILAFLVDILHLEILWTNWPMRAGRILGESNGILKLLIPRCVAFTRTTMRMPTRSTAPRAPREGKAVARRCDAVRCGSSDHVLSRCVLYRCRRTFSGLGSGAPTASNGDSLPGYTRGLRGRTSHWCWHAYASRRPCPRSYERPRTHDRERRPIGRNLEVQTSECGPILMENRSTTLLAVRPAARRELKA